MTPPDRRATLLALADEAERAEGPSRRLDNDIALLARPDLYADGGCEHNRNGGHVSLLRDGKPYKMGEAPRFSSSLDAAASLVPPRTQVSLWFDAVGGACTISQDQEHGGDYGRDLGNCKTARTAAQALLAAALRAQAEGGDRG